MGVKICKDSKKKKQARKSQPFTGASLFIVKTFTNGKDLTAIFMVQYGRSLDAVGISLPVGLEEQNIERFIK